MSRHFWRGYVEGTALAYLCACVMLHLFDILPGVFRTTIDVCAAVSVAAVLWMRRK